VFSLAPVTLGVKVIWAGSDDGLVQVTRNGGRTWTNVTPKDMPEFGRVSQIDASSFDNGSAYVAVKRPLLDDTAPYIFRTHDFGQTWTKIVNGILPNDYVHTVREDHTRRGLLYAGTRLGVYISYDDGGTWESLSLNLPKVPINDLVVEKNALVLGTHGRSFYVLDNIEALRQMTPAISASQDPYLFRPGDAIRSAGSAQIQYWLKRPVQSLTIDIIDAAGRTAYSVAGAATPAGGRAGAEGRAGGGGGGGGRGGRGGGGGGAAPMGAGLHTVQWGLQYPNATTFEGMILWGASTSGPMAVPGTYTVRMTVDGRRLEQPLKVVKHPLYKDVTQADLEAQFALAIRIRDKLSEANQAVIRVRDIKGQVTDRLGRSSDARLKTVADTLVKQIGAVEEEIYQVRNQSGQDPLNFPIKVNNRLATLLSMAERGDGAPTSNMPEIFGILTTELKGYTDRLEQIWKTDLVAVNKELARLKLPPLDPRCPKAEGCGVM